MFIEHPLFARTYSLYIIYIYILENLILYEDSKPNESNRSLVTCPSSQGTESKIKICMISTVS